MTLTEPQCTRLTRGMDGAKKVATRLFGLPIIGTNAADQLDRMLLEAVLQSADLDDLKDCIRYLHRQLGILNNNLKSLEP